MSRCSQNRTAIPPLPRHSCAILRLSWVGICSSGVSCRLASNTRMITILRPSTYLQPNFKATAIDLHSELLDHFGLSAAVRSVAAFCLSDTTALGMDGPERTFVDGAANDSSEPLGDSPKTCCLRSQLNLRRRPKTVSCTRNDGSGHLCVAQHFLSKVSMLELSAHSPA